MNKILEIEKEYGFILPKQYKKFLVENDGVSFDGGLILYSIEELKQMNDDMEIQKYQEKCIAIGDDGGGLVFLMKQDIEATEVFCVDMADYDINEPYCKFDDFEKWYKKGCIISKKENEYSQEGDIYLIKSPENGMKDLIKIKKVFNLDISTAQLLLLSKQIPCKLIGEITYAKALKLMEEVGQKELFEFKGK